MKVRPIDANALLEEMKSLDVTISGVSVIHKQAKESIIKHIEQQPTLDYEPVVHAHWIDKDKDCEDWHIHQYECSNCGMGDQHNPNVNVPYCWFCGAKMDEEQK